MKHGVYAAFYTSITWDYWDNTFQLYAQYNYFIYALIIKFSFMFNEIEKIRFNGLN